WAAGWAVPRARCGSSRSKPPAQPRISSESNVNIDCENQLSHARGHGKLFATLTRYTSLMLARLRVEEGSRRVALEYLTDAARARGRLDDPEDAEALHDLRVALRRLRSLERAYRPWLADSISRKLRQRLRDLARSTNVARDTEVQIEWIGKQRTALQGRKRRGLEWMVEWLVQRKTAAYADVRKQVAAEFDAFAVKVERRLRCYTARLGHTG